MIKEITIFAVVFMALCQAVPIEDSHPEPVPEAVPVEKADGDAENDDLALEASAWGGYGRRYYGGGYGHGGWGRGWGGGWRGGWGGGRGGGWGGYRGGYGSYWG